MATATYDSQMKLIKSASNGSACAVTLTGEGVMLNIMGRKSSFVGQYDLSINLIYTETGEANAWNFPTFNNRNVEEVTDTMRITSDWTWQNTSLVEDILSWAFGEEFADEDVVEDMYRFWGIECLGW